MADEFDYDAAMANIMRGKEWIKELENQYMAAGASPQEATQAAAETVAKSSITRPSRMQPPDMTGVKAGQFGLPPMPDFSRNALAGELRSTNTPMGDLVGAYDTGLGALTSKAERGAGFITRGAAELTGVPQAVRAGNALGDALIEPSLANITDAGTQAALAVGRPVAAAGALGAGYLTAAAKDLGALDMSANAQQPKKVELPGLTPEQNAEYNDLQTKVSRGAWGTRLEANQTAERIRSLRALSDKWVTDNADSLRRTEEAKRASAQSEYDTAVKGANDRLAEDKQRAKDQNFYNTEVGKIYKKTGVITPLVASTGVGAVSRAAGRPMGEAVGMGALTGGMAANYPLLHNTYYQDAYNPEKAAYQAYARDLPPEHPRRAEWDTYAKSLPEQNPAQKLASEQMWDPAQLMMRTGLGVAEGVLGGHLGHTGWEIPINWAKTGFNKLAGALETRSDQRSSAAAARDTPVPAGSADIVPPVPPVGPMSSSAYVGPNVLATGNLAARGTRMPESAASAPGQPLPPEALSNRPASEILGSVQRPQRDVPTSFPQSTPPPNPAPVAENASKGPKMDAAEKRSLRDKWDYDVNGVPYWTENHGRIRGSTKMTLEEREMLGIEPKKGGKSKSDD